MRARVALGWLAATLALSAPRVARATAEDGAPTATVVAPVATATVVAPVATATVVAPRWVGMRMQVSAGVALTRGLVGGGARGSADGLDLALALIAMDDVAIAGYVFSLGLPNTTPPGPGGEDWAGIRVSFGLRWISRLFRVGGPERSLDVGPGGEVEFAVTSGVWTGPDCDPRRCQAFLEVHSHRVGVRALAGPAANLRWGRVSAMLMAFVGIDAGAGYLSFEGLSTRESTARWAAIVAADRESGSVLALRGALTIGVDL